MSEFYLPFQPIRSTLYSVEELFEGLRLSDSQTYSSTRDFKIYSYFVRNGGANSGDFLSTMMRSLHDNSITNALRAQLVGERCVAIMGGHDMGRNEPAYKGVATLARLLSQKGFRLASGGGPGAMEATHLGAVTSALPESDLNAAIRALSKQPFLPKDLKNIVSPDGTVNLQLIAAVYAWFKPAMEVLSGVVRAERSLAVPTWNYGHEPTTPFATDIAKYFQNSIREDGLVTIGKCGIIFTEGKAGTIQEIFQDTALNYYAAAGAFSPMVFLGSEYWRDKYPIWPVLESLFTPQQTKKCILITDDIGEVIAFLAGFKSSY